MFFKVGETVTVRHDFKSGIRYCNDDGSAPWLAVSGMEPFAGQSFVIMTARDIDRGYKVRGNGNTYWWTDEMFEEYVHPFSGGEFETASPDDLASLLGVMA